jgi:hypothetical protein
MQSLDGQSESRGVELLANVQGNKGRQLIGRQRLVSGTKTDPADWKIVEVAWSAPQRTTANEKNKGGGKSRACAGHCLSSYKKAALIRESGLFMNACNA